MSATTQFDLAAYMKARALEVDAAMEAYLPEGAVYLGRVGEAMRYSCFPGGKRFRPFCALAACEALGQPRIKAMPVACAYEMVHCFSLVHDDLPCMDDDAERRGKPTCHIAYGEDLALLAGDALMIWAFHALTDSDVSGPVLKMLVRDLAEASGHPGMVGGQVIDLDGQKRGSVDAAGLLAIHEAKTGALIRGAVRGGALVGGADADQLHRLSEYGKRVGLVFQITDDILDAAEDPEPVSFPALFGMDESKRMAREAVDESLEFLSAFGPGAEPLRRLATFLLDRSH